MAVVCSTREVRDVKRTLCQGISWVVVGSDPGEPRPHAKAGDTAPSERKQHTDVSLAGHAAEESSTSVLGVLEDDDVRMQEGISPETKSQEDPQQLENADLPFPLLEE